MFKKKRWELEWGATVSQPSPLLFLSYPLHICCTHVNPCGSERRGPFPSLHSPPLFPLPELTVGTIKTLKKRSRGWRKKKKSWGVGGRERDPLVVGNKSQTLWEQQEPCLHPRALSPFFKAPLSMQSPSPSQGPPAPCAGFSPFPSLRLGSSPDPFAHYPLHQPFSKLRGSLSLTHNLRAPSLPLSLCLSQARTQRDFSSPGATFTLAPGSALPLNHNTAIQHMPPSYSSSLTLQTTAKNFTIVPQRARN